MCGRYQSSKFQKDKRVGAPIAANIEEWFTNCLVVFSI
jgi:hypothetical protein